MMSSEQLAAHFLQHQERLLSFVRGRGRDPELAVGIAQDASLKAITHRSQNREEENVVACGSTGFLDAPRAACTAGGRFGWEPRKN